MSHSQGYIRLKHHFFLRSSPSFTACTVDCGWLVGGDGRRRLLSEAIWMPIGRLLKVVLRLFLEHSILIVVFGGGELSVLLFQATCTWLLLEFGTIGSLFGSDGGDEGGW